MGLDTGLDNAITANILDINWVAGIIDGEGSLCFGQAGRTKMGILPMIIVGNTNKGMIDRLYELFGGSIRAHPTKTSTNRTYWFWQLNGKKVAIICALLAPWLVVKQQQAFLTILTQKLRDDTKANDLYHRAYPLTSEEKELRKILFILMHRLNVGELKSA